MEVMIASFDSDDEGVGKTFEMASGQVKGSPELELQAIKLFHDTLHLGPFPQYITHLQTVLHGLHSRWACYSPTTRTTRLANAATPAG